VPRLTLAPSHKKVTVIGDTESARKTAGIKKWPLGRRSDVGQREDQEERYQWCGRG